MRTMRRRAFLASSAALGVLRAATGADGTLRSVPRRFGDGRDWFFEARYGLFIHWGLYAIRGFHEQEQWRARVPRAEYVKLAQQWNPTRFDPDSWLDLMEAAGMRYLCFTTKHHDGFCLWATRQTPFNTMNTPYRRDVLRLLADACHRRGVPLCLYYSIADWNHPCYPNQGRHHELPPQPGDTPDWARYLDFLRAQVRELCTEYGRIHGFWWDMNVPQHRDPSINAMIRELQPGIIINNRGFDEGDFGTPEREYDRAAAEALVFERPTEACQSVGMESWGWREEEDYYTDRHLMRSIAAYCARGANYLLNVGPRADGTIPERAAGILRRLGEWYRRVCEAWTGTENVSAWIANRNVLLTRRGRTLYVIAHRDPVGEAIKLKPLALAPIRATLLNTGAPVRWTLEMAPSDHAEQRGYLRLRELPANEMANEPMVVRLEFDRDLQPPVGGPSEAAA
ncbi:MAG: alpha-L-fucosidase [Kiritimatiellae bacterium]|nr:alpha-L-fucosidase [Kiritimatiellia bacterium]